MEEDEEAAAAAEADVGEVGDDGWWRRKSRPPASRQRCRRSASMATRWSAEEGRKEGERNASFFSLLGVGAGMELPAVVFLGVLGSGSLCVGCARPGSLPFWVCCPN
jgi:hypothetical protein